MYANMYHLLLLTHSTSTFFSDQSKRLCVVKVIFEPLIRSIFSTGVLLSSRIVWPSVITANEPFSGGDRPPHVNLDDQTSM